MGSGSSSYRPKAIYLDIDGRIQKVVFSKYCNSSDIMDLFCIATGLPRNTTISLLTTDDAMVSIDPTMPANSESTPYKVRPVALKQLSEKEELIQSMLTQVAEQFSRAFKINELKAEVANHLAVLEKRVELEGLKVVEIEKCKSDIKKMREELAARSNRCHFGVPGTRLTRCWGRDWPSDSSSRDASPALPPWEGEWTRAPAR